MSSPHRMRIFGLLVLAFSLSFDLVKNFRTTSRLACPPQGSLHEAQQHGTKGEHADQDEGERDRIKRSLQSFFCHSGERRKAPAPEVTKCPMVLPDRDDKGHDPTGDQR